MGYVPSVESRLKLYDGIEIDLNTTWARTGSGCSTVLRSQKIFNQGKTPGAYFYIFRPGFESAKKVSKTEQRVELMNYILQDTPEFIQQSKHFRCGYVRCSYLGCKRILLLMVNTEPAKVRAVYESKTFSLELMFMHAMKKNVITNRNGVFTWRYC
jgi:hypothetical protein